MSGLFSLRLNQPLKYTALIVLVLTVYSFTGFTTKSVLQTASAKERKIEFKNSLDQVVKLEVSGLDKENFPQDIKVKVTNVYHKPIYYLLIFLTYPETTKDNSVEGIRLEFGNSRLSFNENRATETDPAIQPGAEHVFTLPQDKIKFHREKRQIDFSKVNVVRLNLQYVSFGDGTQYFIGRFVSKQKAQSNETRKYLNTSFSNYLSASLFALNMQILSPLLF
jgi:hypothetical protein